MKKDKKFIYLLNNEIDRGKKIMFTAFVFIIVAALLLYSFEVVSVKKEILDAIKYNSLNEYMVNKFYSESISPINFSFQIELVTVIFSTSIGLGILLVYAAFTWYREWFGSNKTIYTLLMLPTSKSKVIIAKLISIMYYFLILVAMVYISLIFQYKIFYLIMPSNVVERIGIIKYIQEIIYEYPFINSIYVGLFILFFISVILIIFVAVFIERYIRIKGLIISIIYGFAYIALYTYIPFCVLKLYQVEIIMYFFTISMVAIILNFKFAKYLLENKVSV